MARSLFQRGALPAFPQLFLVLMTAGVCLAVLLQLLFDMGGLAVDRYRSGYLERRLEQLDQVRVRLERERPWTGGEGEAPGAAVPPGQGAQQEQGQRLARRLANVERERVVVAERLVQQRREEERRDGRALGGLALTVALAVMGWRRRRELGYWGGFIWLLSGCSVLMGSVAFYPRSGLPGVAAGASLAALLAFFVRNRGPRAVTLGRRGRWVLRALLAGGLCLLPAVVAINHFDPPLNPEALSIAQGVRARQGVENDPAGNGYYALMGFLVAEGRDPHAAGLVRVREFNRLVEAGAGYQALREAGDRLEREQTLAVREEERLCDFRKGPCLAEYQRDPQRVAALEEANRLLLERYESLHRYGNFRETVHANFHAPFPRLGALKGMLRLRLARIGLLLLAGERAAAWDTLEAEGRLWRLMLQESRSLVGRMAFLQGVREVARCGGEMMAAQGRLDPVARTVLMGLLAPLTPAQKSMGPAIEGEFAAMVAGVSAMDRDGLAASGELARYGPFSWMADLLFQPHRTINHFVPRHLEAVSLDHTPPERFAEERERWRARWLTSEEARSFRPRDWFINPVGRMIIVSGGLWDQTRVFQRVIETEGVLRLGRLALAIHAGDVRLAEIPGFIQQSRAAYGNPFDGAAAQWDPRSGRLWFDSGETAGASHRRGEEPAMVWWVTGLPEEGDSGAAAQGAEAAPMEPLVGMEEGEERP